MKLSDLPFIPAMFRKGNKKQYICANKNITISGTLRLKAGYTIRSCRVNAEGKAKIVVLPDSYLMESVLNRVDVEYHAGGTMHGNFIHGEFNIILPKKMPDTPLQLMATHNFFDSRQD